MPAVKGVALESITCPLCSAFKSKRLTSFEDHLRTEHSTTAQGLWDSLHSGPGKCGCGCGQTTTWHGWKKGYADFVNRHASNSLKAFGPERAAEISAKRSASLRGKTSWAKGLTKETDERVRTRGERTSEGRKRAFEEGRISVWCKGHTKESDPRLQSLANSLHEAHQSGRTAPWAKGLTEDVDPRLKKKNDQLRQRFASGELKPWHAGKTKEEDPRISKIWANRDPHIEYQDVRWSDEEIRSQLSTNTHLQLQGIVDYRNDRVPALDIICKDCGWIDRATLVFARNDRCPNCSPMGSNIQNRIADWIQSLGFEVGRNVSGVIGRQELDVFVPARMLAIEVDGLYWHNEAAGKGPKYHQEKTDACRALGINLIHVFDDEWYHKESIVRSIISAKLGHGLKTVHGRKCRVVELDTARRREFFQTNHLDGDVPCTAAWGLEDEEGNLVYGLSLRRPFHRKYESMLEVGRCCPKTNTNVQGGLSKLVSRAQEYSGKEGKAGLLTYVDTRLGGDGRGYLMSGFTKVDETSPRFWWTNGHQRFNRFRIRARNGMSENEVAKQEKMSRIWGCRNVVYTLQT